jgi:hypothetical protein
MRQARALVLIRSHYTNIPGKSLLLKGTAKSQLSIFSKVQFCPWQISKRVG